MKISAIKGLTAIVLLGLTSACSELPDWLGEKQAPPLKGTRIAILPEVNKLEADVNGGEEVSLPNPSPRSNFLQVPSNAYVDMGNVETQSLKTYVSAEGGRGADFPINLIPDPVAADGLVFAMDGKGNISAHNETDIKKVAWTATIAEKEYKYPYAGGGFVIAEGILYVVSGSGDVAAFEDKTGKVIFRRALNVPARSSPRVDNDKLYFTTADNQLYAVSVKDGTLLWKHTGLQESAGIAGAATPAIFKNNVIVTYSSGEVFALDTVGGREVWAESLARIVRGNQSDALSDVDVTPVIADDMLYLSSHSGAFSAYDMKTGRPLWERTFALVSPPWIVGDYLFAMTTKSELVVMQRRSGVVMWVKKLKVLKNEKNEATRIAWSGPVIANSKITMVAGDGRILMLSLDGSFFQKTNLPESIYSNPVVTSNGLYLINKSADLIRAY